MLVHSKIIQLDTIADYIQLAARTNEIWAVITEQYVPGQAEFNEGSVYSRACERAITTAEDVIDKWPHSVPSLSVQIISQNRPPDQVHATLHIS